MDNFNNAKTKENQFDNVESAAVTFLKSPRGIIAVSLVTIIILGLFILFSPKQTWPSIPINVTAPTPISSNYTTNNQDQISSSLYFVADSNNSGITVMLNTKNQYVSGAQLALAYNPHEIINVYVSSGNFFSNPIILQNTIDQLHGIIYFTLAIQPGDLPVQGNSALAFVHYTKIPNSPPTTLSFLPETVVTVKGVNTSVLKNVSDIQLE